MSASDLPPGTTLVLCHGNTHRSPLCGKVLSVFGVPNVVTAGLAPASHNNNRAAKKIRDLALVNGYDLSGHRSKLVLPQWLSQADMVIYMDSGNLARILRLQKDCRLGIINHHCLGEWADPPVKRIKDPAFLSTRVESQYLELEATVLQIIRASEWLAVELIKKGQT